MWDLTLQPGPILSSLLPGASEGMAQGRGALCGSSGLWHVDSGGGNGTGFPCCAEVHDIPTTPPKEENTPFITRKDTVGA